MLHLDIQRAAPFFRGFRGRDRGGKEGLGHRSVLVSVLGVAILAGSAIHRGQSQGTQQVDFEREIQPIFRVSCYACHQEGNATAQLRLDSKDAAFKGGVSGRIIVFGTFRGHDPAEMLEALGATEARLVIICTAPWPRAIPALEIAEAARSLGITPLVIEDPLAATKRAMTEAEEGEMVFVTGSLYVVGAVRSGLGAR